MKVTLMVVMSLDGKTTLGDQPGASSWASPEDQEIFQTQIAAHDCVVMGSATYKAARHIIRPSASKPRTVLTRAPQRFADEVQPGIAFSADPPSVVVEKAKGKGCTSLLLVGGAKTSARFFDEGLIDEVLVTIEPSLFGAGLPFVTPLQRAISLQLVTCTQLNSRGTLLAHYFIQKN